MLLGMNGLEAADLEASRRPYCAGPEIKARQVVSKEKLVLGMT